MNCCITELCEKEIINLKDGARIGCVNDVEIDTCSGRVLALIVNGKGKLFSLAGKQEDIKICWDQIQVIGDETILVNVDCPTVVNKEKHGNNLIGNLFREG